MTKLMAMELDNNQLEGEIPFLPRSLVDLDLFNNSLSGQLRKNYKSPYKKRSVLLNNDTGELVEFFPCRQTNFEFLDLSSNNLSGHLPTCWSNISEDSNLSNNSFFGVMPSSLSCSGMLTVLRLNNNNLTGEFPIDLKFCSGLQLLDLGENKYHGRIPDWVGKNMHRLTYLRLHSNLFSGNIPSTLTRLKYLQVLDLGNNHLSGPLPQCLDNFTAMSQSFSSNNVDSGWSIQAMTKGLDLVYDYKNLDSWKSIDLSNNNLTGEIPKNIVVLAGLLNLNLSHNKLVGEIPFEIGNMTSLESLDLHMNNLSGTIPQSISVLNYWEVLNFRLMTGRFPESDDNINSKSKHAGTDTDKWLFLFIVFGFVVGLLVVFFILLFQKIRRYIYFKMVDSGFDKLYVLASISKEEVVGGTNLEI
ncbi:hypothetical protein LUZ61_016125 [Rhynchospora tenuis]|uniref:Uncharacterized protein n=1 Tax=Rhynchospora tenuis TaxID=198213 RepID=A0AAD5Z4Y4_9POAL|nr:hypothetical protein LUZ61_016125 [Rhynchospora tenuis]